MWGIAAMSSEFCRGKGQDNLHGQIMFFDHNAFVVKPVLLAVTSSCVPHTHQTMAFAWHGFAKGYQFLMFLPIGRNKHPLGWCVIHVHHISTRQKTLGVIGQPGHGHIQSQCASQRNWCCRSLSKNISTTTGINTLSLNNCRSCKQANAKCRCCVLAWSNRWCMFKSFHLVTFRGIA